ncbi:formyltetrahydrofolate-dependent phosphoribosylglycinamide formyltransferase [Proteiniborus ethanoligenes]|uniref:Phosphoribosylglycinamide formyltransferase n=1 Tax=Proteiniborus ethanoligenes TaxID=415015 RepID=A0A1H3S6V0_9FIRM|nr:phosphoribosylglycinamide formyltransferase [Proteiniborus ethanoligenes]SDZ33460.1 formyltetrahydrofolate-dependent phosphoribosylglycinamide formyltransferase [Proteiniborus ethanoligenes]
MSPVKIGVLISGSGTNLQTLIDNINSGDIYGEISVVISNKKDAYGLTRAKNNGIDAVYIDRKNSLDDIEFNKKIIEELKKRDVQLVVLAGYLRILSSEFISQFRNRIINIHPSLIPSFCGKGYYGEKVHKAVLDYGAKITGATVHFVDEEADTGPIIFQKSVEISEGDNVETLKNKVLEVEHLLLSEAVRLYCKDKIIVIGRKVIVRE